MTVEAAPGCRTEDFTDAMARLATGLAVVTARSADGEPCGLLVSSLCSYSVRPPSVLMAIDQAARSYPALVRSDCFGVHLLGAAQLDVAGTFAGRGQRKFEGTDWRWEGPVPRLAGAPVFLFCTTAAVLAHGDHAVVVGEVRRTDAVPGRPLVYYQRRGDWEIRLPGAGR